MVRKDRIVKMTNVEHPQTETKVKGQTVLVDVGLVDLINGVNRINGVTTLYSCQGEKSGLAYLLFTGKRAKVFLHVLLDKIMRVSRTSPGYVAILCESHNSNQYVIRWEPEMYTVILKAIILTANQMKGEQRGT